MKVLYIYPKLKISASGGVAGYTRNRESVIQYYGASNVICYPVERSKRNSRFVMLANDLLSLGIAGLSNKDKTNCVEAIKTSHVELVFIDSSLFGVLARYIKKRCDVKIVIFFHNVEFDYIKTLLSQNVFFAYRILLAWLNEKMVIKYSDYTIALNQKDSNRIFELYNRKVDMQIPVTFKDSKTGLLGNSDYSSPLRVLFFGSFFPPNVEAVDILVKKICPHVNINLLIAGSEMDKLKNKYTNIPGVEIKGYIDDVNELYNWADLVVIPIFSGAGMKVKTAEALMYGKNIIASENALEGYETEGVSGIIKCKDVKDFIFEINNFDLNLDRMNMGARELFLKKYSFNSSYSKFSELFSKISD